MSFFDNVISLFGGFTPYDYEEFSIEKQASTLTAYRRKNDDGSVDVMQINDEGESLTTRLTSDEVEGLIKFLSK